MKIRALIIIALVLVSINAYCADTSVLKPAKAEPITFHEWSIRVSIPKPFQENPLSDQTGAVLSKLYIVGDMAYLVKVHKVSPDIFADTAVEQAVQTAYAAANKLGSGKRWELDTRSGNFFKGCSGLVEFDDATLATAPYLKDLLKGNTGCQSLSMVPIKDGTATLSIGAIGVKGQEDKVYVAAVAAAESVKLLRVVQPVKKDTVRTKVLQKSAESKKQKPEAVKRQPAKPKARPADKPIVLKKHQIQLTGMLDSFAQDGKSLTLIVDQVIMPGEKPVTLTPTRSKIVLIKKIPGTLLAGMRITVVGINEGIGKPIQPSIIRESKQ